MGRCCRRLGIHSFTLLSSTVSLQAVLDRPGIKFRNIGSSRLAGSVYSSLRLCFHEYLVCFTQLSSLPSILSPSHSHHHTSISAGILYQQGMSARKPDGSVSKTKSILLTASTDTATSLGHGVPSLRGERCSSRLCPSRRICGHLWHVEFECVSKVCEKSRLMFMQSSRKSSTLVKRPSQL